ncbi:response regulator [Pseudomaricurvus alkylphenolicus]|uniref:response regulator n=1 Tax=Pseudomaricurvus alkylphenolicus TaxID=1306991 RepID=UPI001420D670|nr:response regulator [Pseudomaricurvus alkylphenolicus]NIB39474.1 response regulator [Pseudomaricurvus alkylphenolicus]
MKEKLLIVEDEIKLAHLLRDYLTPEGFECHCLYEGNDVIAWVKQNQPVFVLLDLMLPGKDGMTICREIRQFSDLPIMMLTARVEEIDRLLGLELGADDYVCKPYSPREVVARVKTILRRLRPRSSQQTASSVYLDSDTYQLHCGSKHLALTALEFQLMSLMINEPGRIFSRNQLMDAMYNDHRVVSERTIDSHIKKLRKKICQELSQEELIQSVYGVGYKFLPPVD